MRARTAGVFYLLVFVTGFLPFFISGRMFMSSDPAATAANIQARPSLFALTWALNLLAGVCYVVVTALFYELFKPVNRTASLTAAFFSLVGCALGGVSSLFQLAPLVILKNAPYLKTIAANELVFLFLKMGYVVNVGLVFFGLYCLTIGYLILKSTFLPRFLGAGMVMAGLGWLTFLWPPLAAAIAPYNFLPGIIGEGTLTFWLLVMGANEERWSEQMRSASFATS